MLDFWAKRFAEIDWNISPLQGLSLLLLGLWIYAIWPKEELLQVVKDKGLQWRLLLTLIAVNTLWLLNASIQVGIHLHFLGIVTCLLMFGWRRIMTGAC